MKQRIYRAFEHLQASTSNQRNPAAWLMEFFGSTPSKTGVKVTTNSVLGLAPVIYAVNKISGHMSELPFNVYPSGDVNKELLAQSPAYRLLNKRPNDFMTSQTLREVMMVHALIQGNGRAYISRNSIGTPIALTPIAPQDCQTLLVDNQKWHLINKVAGAPQSCIPELLVKGEYYKVRDRDMIHIMNTSYNGIWGMHLMEMAKDVFGLTQAGQDVTATTLANSGRPSLLLEAPVGMFRNAKDSKEFLDNFNEKHEGISNAGKAGLLRDGMKATTLPTNSQDAQLLQQRGFQREEVALLFGLESIMGDNSGQTYKSISERNTAYINNCLQRWIRKWETEIEDKLTNPSRPTTVEVDTTPLLKGDPSNLAGYTQLLQQTGIITINEARALHGMPPVADGDKLPHQMAMEIAQASEPAEDQDDPEETEKETNEPQTTEENDETGK